MDKIEELKQQLNRLQSEYDNIIKHIQYISSNPTNADEIKYMQQRDVQYWKKQFEDVKTEMHRKQRELKCCIDENTCLTGLRTELNVDISNISLENILMNIDVRYNNRYTKVARNKKTGDVVIQTMAWLNLFEPDWETYKDLPNRNMLLKTAEDYADAVATKYICYTNNIMFFKGQDKFREHFPTNYIKILDIGGMTDGTFTHMTELCEQNGTMWISADIMIYVKKYSDIGSEMLDDEWDKKNIC
mgnify:CR=1 FL=1